MRHYPPTLEKLTSTLCILFILMVQSVASEPAMKSAGPSSSTALLTEIVKLNDNKEVKVALAAIFLQELLINSHSFFKQSLASYRLDTPQIIDSQTDDGRDYSLVVFRSNDNHDSGGFAIFQHCQGRLILRERGFAAEIDDSIIQPFVSAAKSASADYYETDACAQFPGSDW